MQPTSRARRPNMAGFTLIEVAIVSPIVILVVGALIVMAVSLTGSAMRSTSRAHMQNDVLGALDRLEQDVRLSTKVEVTVNAANQITRIELRSFATDKNPLNNDRRLIKADCTSAVAGVAADEALTYKITYSVSADQLQRTVELDKGCSGNSNVWQKHGQVENLFAIPSMPELRREPATDNISGVVEVKLRAARQVAGETISFTGYLYAKSLNLN